MLCPIRLSSPTNAWAPWAKFNNQPGGSPACSVASSIHFRTHRKVKQVREDTATWQSETGAKSEEQWEDYNEHPISIARTNRGPSSLASLYRPSCWPSKFTVMKNHVGKLVMKKGAGRWWWWWWESTCKTQNRAGLKCLKVLNGPDPDRRGKGLRKQNHRSSKRGSPTAFVNCC